MSGQPRVVATVPAMTGGGPCGDTGDCVSLSRALEESSSTLYDKKELLCVCPANVEKSQLSLSILDAEL